MFPLFKFLQLFHLFSTLILLFILCAGSNQYRIRRLGWSRSRAEKNSRPHDQVAATEPPSLDFIKVRFRANPKSSILSFFIFLSIFCPSRRPSQKVVPFFVSTSNQWPSHHFLSRTNKTRVSGSTILWPGCRTCFTMMSKLYRKMFRRWQLQIPYWDSTFKVQLHPKQMPWIPGRMQSIVCLGFPV